MTDGAFPTGWALQKPQQTIEPGEFERRWRAGGLTATRKRDGNRLHIVTAGRNTRVWSRNGTTDLTEKLAHIAHHYAAAPAGYILDGEGHTAGEGTESYQWALNHRPEDILFSAFDALSLDGDLQKKPWSARRSWLDGLDEALGRRAGIFGGGVCFDLPDNPTYDDVLKRIDEDRCEGVVIWDERAPHQLNTNGNTKRGQCWKIKVRQTEDLVVTMVHPCADPALGCGALSVARRISPDGPLEPLGKVGSFALPFERQAALSANLPFVVEVSHFGEDDRANLVFATVERARPDLHGDFGIA